MTDNNNLIIMEDIAPDHKKDSLLLNKTKLKNNPKTIRNSCRKYLLAIKKSPRLHFLSNLAFGIFGALHFLIFLLLIYLRVISSFNFQNVQEIRSITFGAIFCPLMLIVGYPMPISIALIPIMISDVNVSAFLKRQKREGCLAWHRDSAGLLFQKLVFCMMAFFVFLLACLYLDALYDKRSDSPHPRDLIILLVPLVVLDVLLFFRILCFRVRDTLFWMIFVLLSLLQFSFLIVTIDQPDAVPYAFRWLPTGLLLISFDIFWLKLSLWPQIGKIKLPLFIIKIRQILGSLSVITSIIALVLFEIYLLRQGNKNEVKLDLTQIDLLKTILILLVLKVIFTTPFLSQMLQDLVFDHLYTDIEYELKPVVMVGLSPTPPRQKKAVGKAKKKIRHKSLELVTSFE